MFGLFKKKPKTIEPDDSLRVPRSASTKGGLQLLREAVKETRARDTTHGLTMQLLVRRGDKWEAFDERAA